MDGDIRNRPRVGLKPVMRFPSLSQDKLTKACHEARGAKEESL